MNEIKEKFQKVETARNELKGKCDLLQGNIEERKRINKHRKREYKIQEEVLDTLRALSLLKEQSLKEKVDKVVTKGLQSILGIDNVSSRLEFKISRGQATVETKIVTLIEGEEMITDIEGSESGGLANVIGFIYQLLILSLKRPRKRQAIFADEPFKNLSKRYLAPTAQFIRTLAERLGVQVVLITHQKELEEIGDKLYEFSKTEGETKVCQIR